MFCGMRAHQRAFIYGNSATCGKYRAIVSMSRSPGVREGTRVVADLGSSQGFHEARGYGRLYRAYRQSKMKIEK